MKMLAVCQSGLGSSFMVQMNIQQILKDKGIEDVEVDHTDVGSVSNNDADYFFVESTLREAVSNLDSDKVIYLKSLIDLDEIKKAIDKVFDK